MASGQTSQPGYRSRTQSTGKYVESFAAGTASAAMSAAPNARASATALSPCCCRLAWSMYDGRSSGAWYTAEPSMYAEFSPENLPESRNGVKSVSLGRIR